MAFFWWALLTLILGGIFYLISTFQRQAKYFENKGVYYMGNQLMSFVQIMRGKVTLTQNLMNLYEGVKGQNVRFGGSMELGKPGFFIVDLDLMKLVLVKDFDHFVDRRVFSWGDKDDILSRTLLSREGDEWKALRVKMTPTFSTGKIRRMFAIMDESGQKMAKYLTTEISESNGVVDLQEAYSKYAIDVIASVAFGLDSKAFDQRKPSTFEKKANLFQFKFSVKGILIFVLNTTLPKVAAFFGIKFFSKEGTDFFSNVIKSAIKYRQETKEQRNDFLQLMLEARDGRLKVDDGGELTDYEKAMIVNKGQEVNPRGKVSLELDDDDIVAQSVLFFIGGYDTTMSLLLFSGYNLAVYPEIQQKVYEEVKKSFEENGGKLTYDSINGMEYLDMFISETLRYCPPAIAAERICTKPYKIPESNVVIEKGSIVQIPIYAIHHDPQVYPEPQKFDPERFSPKNKADLHPCAFIPFGYGPRSCIAMRLALVEAKMSVAHLVLKFSLEPTEKTPIPIKFSDSGALKPQGGLWLKLTPRT